VVTAACTQGKVHETREAPRPWSGDDQPEAREGQAGAPWGGGEVRSVRWAAHESGGESPSGARMRALYPKAGVMPRRPAGLLAGGQGERSGIRRV
jgi:hypothetical protein